MEKRSIGRPTKYNDELQEEADRYVYEWADIGDAVPSRVGLCCFLGIGKKTSYEWEKIHLDFRATLEAVDALQEHVAMNNGITGKFNSTIVKLVLANHGYSDKQAIDHTTGGEKIKTFASMYEHQPKNEDAES